MRYLFIGAVALALLAVVGQLLAEGWHSLAGVPWYVWVFASPIAVVFAWNMLQEILAEQNEKELQRREEVRRKEERRVRLEEEARQDYDDYLWDQNNNY